MDDDSDADDDDDFDEDDENGFFGGRMSQEIVIDPELQRAARLKNSKLPTYIKYGIIILGIIIVILICLAVFKFFPN